VDDLPDDEFKLICKRRWRRAQARRYNNTHQTETQRFVRKIRGRWVTGANSTT